MEHRTQLLIDSHVRILRDPRVSVTDRCHFHCLYCLPERILPRDYLGQPAWRRRIEVLREGGRQLRTFNP
jgi:molybdenum cofactor biosynthesis enzyme MoaA